MKAILVMDMPRKCDECDFCEHQDEGWLWCNRCEKTARAFDRSDWCPLKPIPSKKDKPTKSESVACFNSGYNACIDEILGDKDKNEK